MRRPPVERRLTTAVTGGVLRLHIVRGKPRYLYPRKLIPCRQGMIGLNKFRKWWLRGKTNRRPQNSTGKAAKTHRENVEFNSRMFLEFFSKKVLILRTQRRDHGYDTAAPNEVHFTFYFKVFSGGMLRKLKLQGHRLIASTFQLRFVDRGINWHTIASRGFSAVAEQSY